MEALIYILSICVIIIFVVLIFSLNKLNELVKLIENLKPKQRVQSIKDKSPVLKVKHENKTFTIGNKRTIMVFVSPSCDGCKKLIQYFPHMDVPSDLELLVITKDKKDEEVDDFSLYQEAIDHSNAKIIYSSEVLRTFNITTFPSHIILNNDGVITKQGITKNLSIFEEEDIKIREKSFV